MEQHLAVEQTAERFAFRHALTREVIYQDLLPSERKRLHRAVADTLARRHAAEPAIVAHHFVAAGATAEAVPHLLRAAVRARDAGAPREAAAHYKHALDIGASGGDVAPTLEDLAEAYMHFDVVLAAKAADQARERDVTSYPMFLDWGAARAYEAMAGFTGTVGTFTTDGDADTTLASRDSS